MNLRNIRKIEVLLENPEIKQGDKERILLRIQPADNSEGSWFVKEINELDNAERVLVDNILSMATSLTIKQKEEEDGEKKDSSC